MEEKSREQEMSAREISLIRELAQIRKEYKPAYLLLWLGAFFEKL